MNLKIKPFTIIIFLIFLQNSTEAKKTKILNNKKAIVITSALITIASTSAFILYQLKTKQISYPLVIDNKPEISDHDSLDEKQNLTIKENAEKAISLKELEERKNTLKIENYTKLSNHSSLNDSKNIFIKEKEEKVIATENKNITSDLPTYQPVKPSISEKTQIITPDDLFIDVFSF